jgi:crotonobetainyl-CoA:carnitine CoA-transferase CaiB-like acyl-CoA transferase
MKNVSVSPRLPLSGVRVLDMTRVLAGPWCGQNLADLGAEVIKVEKPGVGDDTRSWGPPFLKATDGNDTTDAAYYLAANRGKKSITIDISTEKGQELIRQLAAKADVLLENYKVGQLSKYGLGYEHLKALHPGLIYCSITGFGQTGPWAHRAGYDFIIQGLGGFMSITGEADDQAGGGPQKAGVAVADLMTGMFATQAVLAALLHKRSTGEGQAIDLALLDVQVAMLANMNTNYLASGQPPRRWGNAHPNIVPYQTFKANDGWIIVACGNDGQFAKFCKVGGCDHLAIDPLFAKNSQRVLNRAQLVPQLVKMVASQSSNFWIDGLEEVGVPCGPINNIDQVFDNPQIQARAMRVDLARDDAAKIKLVANPIKFSGTPLKATLAPPRLGQHSDEILNDWLGLSAAQISQLRAQGTL